MVAEMKKIITLFLPILIILSCSDASDGGSTDTDSWTDTKNNTYVTVEITSEYNTPQKSSIATMGWEDGINVSRNGLYIYATYIPADFLSFVLNGDSVENLSKYDRGPHYDMNFIDNPAAVTYLWYQSDIIIASRASTGQNFSVWNTSNMKRHSYSEGALSTVFSDDHNIDICAFTSNEEYTAKNNIKLLTSITADPSGIGTFITSTDPTGTSTINTNHIEDNPHIERIDANNLVLFFDSEDRPGGEGSHDIWYSTSTDNGTNWSTPVALADINTNDKEHQPHLYYDGSDWWLYYSAYHTDSKLAIFRAKQTTLGNWDNWDTPELVLSAGNASGIGEPTLTNNGDLYFVVIYENPQGSYYDRYDADPWVALKK